MSAAPSGGESMFKLFDDVKTAEAVEILGVVRRSLRKWAARGDITMRRNSAIDYRISIRAPRVAFFPKTAGRCDHDVRPQIKSDTLKRSDCSVENTIVRVQRRPGQASLQRTPDSRPDINSLPESNGMTHISPSTVTSYTTRSSSNISQTHLTTSTQSWWFVV